jgi:hypothetical protein
MDCVNNRIGRREPRASGHARRRSHDNLRSGLNAGETILTPANVPPRRLESCFRTLWIEVDPKI